LGAGDQNNALELTAVTAVAPNADTGKIIPDQLQLFVIGNGILTAHPLRQAGTLTIGRSSNCDIEVDDHSISRRHAILNIGEAMTIEDLGSANGTFVRGNRVRFGQPTSIAVGELVGLGNASILVQRRLPVAGGPRDHQPAYPLSAEAQEAVATKPATTAGTDIVVCDARMQGLHRLVQQVAGSNICVLLLGETGVGKEVFARAVHRASPRAAGPFVEVNCAALTETLLESELFGHEKGAFTNAVSAKPGLLELAHGGTVLLDEIGDMPLSTQVKLLRVIEDSQLRRVGGLKPRTIDVRFVAATNSDIERQVAQGAFRRDLFFRLNGFTITIPPLRERRAELEPLARAFISRATHHTGGSRPALAPDALERLRGHGWPGNIRELKNVIERAVLLCGSGPIHAEHLCLDKPATPRTSDGSTGSSPRVFAWPNGTRLPMPEEPRSSDTVVPSHPRKGSQEEQQWIMQTLEQAGGNQTVAARLLGISRRTLVSRLHDYDYVNRPKKKPKEQPSE
jgi:DNA-binding NtrC family response regulator